MTLLLAAATSAALLGAAGLAAFHRSPTRSSCPVCGTATVAVRTPPLFRSAERVVRWRWCATCGWEGLGRAGPEWLPGRRLAHDSGFHWGEERFPEDFGFRWRRPGAAAPPAGPPDHPSGFRFSEAPGSSAAHPSGFTWGAGEGRAPTFSWAPPARKPPRSRWRRR